MSFVKSPMGNNTGFRRKRLVPKHAERDDSVKGYFDESSPSLLAAPVTNPVAVSPKPSYSSVIMSSLKSEAPKTEPEGSVDYQTLHPDMIPPRTHSAPPHLTPKPDAVDMLASIMANQLDISEKPAASLRRPSNANPEASAVPSPNKYSQSFHYNKIPMPQNPYCVLYPPTPYQYPGYMYTPMPSYTTPLPVQPKKILSIKDPRTLEEVSVGVKLSRPPAATVTAVPQPIKPEEEKPEETLSEPPIAETSADLSAVEEEIPSEQAPISIVPDDDMDMDMELSVPVGSEPMSEHLYCQSGENLAGSQRKIYTHEFLTGLGSQRFELSQSATQCVRELLEVLNRGSGHRFGHSRRGGFDAVPPGFKAKSRSNVSISRANVPMLPVSEDRWVRPIAEACNEVQRVCRALKGALNKLTPDNFDRIATIILETLRTALSVLSDQYEKTVQAQNEGVVYSACAEEEQAQLVLSETISIIFDKAVAEPHFSPLYAMLCRRLADDPQLPVHPVRQIEGGYSAVSMFKVALLSKCQTEYEKWEREHKGDHSPQTEQGEIDEYEKSKLKRRVLGNISFIGHIYRHGLLREQIIHKCVKELLADPESIGDEEVECCVQLLVTTGSRLDQIPDARQRLHEYFRRLEFMLKSDRISSRASFMIMDLIDLRTACWDKTKIAQVAARKEPSKKTVKQQVIRKGRVRRNDVPTPPLANKFSLLAEGGERSERQEKSDSSDTEVGIVPELIEKSEEVPELVGVVEKSRSDLEGMLRPMLGTLAHEYPGKEEIEAMTAKAAAEGKDDLAALVCDFCGLVYDYKLSTLEKVSRFLGDVLERIGVDTYFDRVFEGLDAALENYEDWIEDVPKLDESLSIILAAILNSASPDVVAEALKVHESTMVDSVILKRILPRALARTNMIAKEMSLAEQPVVSIEDRKEPEADMISELCDAFWTDSDQVSCETLDGLDGAQRLALMNEIAREYLKKVAVSPENVETYRSIFQKLHECGFRATDFEMFRDDINVDFDKGSALFKINAWITGIVDASQESGTDDPDYYHGEDVSGLDI